MNNTFELISLLSGFSAIPLSISFILLIHFLLDWMPARHALITLFSIAVMLKSTITLQALLPGVVGHQLFLITYPLILMLGPLMTRFTKSVLRVESTTLFEKPATRLLVAGYFLLLPMFILSIEGIDEEPSVVLNALAAVGYLAFVMLFIVSSAMHFMPVLWRLFNGALYTVGYGNATYYWLRGVWSSIGVLWLTLVFHNVSGLWEYDPIWIDALFNVVDLIALFVVLVFTVVYCRKSPQEETVQRCLETPKYERSGLTRSDACVILERVENVLVNQALYLDANLTLDKLAQQVRTQPQYLSQAINQYRDMNFHEFIARYRVDFAKRELRSNSTLNILDVAMSAGFNSKSTFNFTFKKIAGMTPSAYRKQAVMQ
ncbi:Melibiose operon regulatory protein [BD1-7 clade bacterium]|uniref:Melibiose operon regulatory protein n=1 Tax=BD1-7 clade bacterium TaxID=2029982 RepID=A0A5S9PIC0_9GAMM|nr:Melibiose operon regulatory protein [BD1-7 clade bacterium]